MTKEGAPAVKEAIDFIKNAQPVSPIRWNEWLAIAARYHVEDTGPKGQVAHESSNGDSCQKRLAKFGRFEKRMGENLSYGKTTGVDVIMQLFIDDGVPDRGHRDNLMNDQFRVVGSYSGSHKKFRTMNCMDYAFDFHKLE